MGGFSRIPLRGGLFPVRFAASPGSKVESSSTTELMLEFHRQLLSGKVSKAEALRRASLKVMKMPKYRHPSYWAGWVLVGDGS